MLDILKTQLEQVTKKITDLAPKDGYLEEVKRCFPLGMVGGSGKNNYKLNRMRELSMQKSIEVSKILTVLYSKRDTLLKQIESIESGDVDLILAKKKKIILARAEYWNSLKVGDLIQIGNNKSLIVKKSKKSIVTEFNCNWTATEIIGKESAALI